MPSLQTTLAFSPHPFFRSGIASSLGCPSSPVGSMHGVRIPVRNPQYTITWSALPAKKIVELAVIHCIANNSFCTSMMFPPKFGLPHAVTVPFLCKAAKAPSVARISSTFGGIRVSSDGGAHRVWTLPSFVHPHCL